MTVRVQIDQDRNGVADSIVPDGDRLADAVRIDLLNTAAAALSVTDFAL